MPVTFVCSALITGLPSGPEWLSTRVFACGLVAVGLVVLALVLRGVQKFMTFLVIGVLAVGGYWLVQDFRSPKRTVLPPELAAEFQNMARRALENPDARAAWEVMQREWSALHGEARARLAAGGEQARAAIARRIDAKAADLRRQGKRTAADELSRFREKISPGS